MEYQKFNAGMRDRSTIAVVVKGPDSEQEAMVLHASESRLRLLTTQPLSRGVRVELVIGGELLTGRVRWRLGRRCSIELDRPISVFALLIGGMLPIALTPEAQLYGNSRRNGGLASDGPIMGRVLQLLLIAAVLAGGVMLLRGAVFAPVSAQSEAPADNGF